MTEEAAEKRSWLPLMILGAAQFVMVLDSSVMNVSISQIVADLHTTIQGVQGAITAYTLVMAAFMLVGAKLGDMYGRDRIFAIGLAVYALGSLTTALSPNLTVLLFGWSFVEGIGAVMVIPAIAALDRGQLRREAARARLRRDRRRRGRGDRGGAADRRLGDDGVQLALRLRRRSRDRDRACCCSAGGWFRRRAAEHRPKLDVVGATFSAIGLGLVVFAILKASTWGWIKPKIAAVDQRPRARRRSASRSVPFLIAIGLGFLMLFAWWEERRERRGEDALLHRALLKIEPLQRGAVDARDDAARPARHVLRASRLSPGRARARRVRDGQAAVPHVRSPC